MKKIFGVLFGIVLTCIMLFTVCSDVIKLTEDNMTIIENGYGRIAVNLIGTALSQKSARTILPSIDFSKFDFYFIKSDEIIEIRIEPAEDGFFTLEIGEYTVVVYAYIDDDDSNIAAIGQSSVFSVGAGLNDPVDVALSETTSEDEGEFFYTITYPEDADAEITLQKWTGTVLENIPLSAVLQENSKSQLLPLDNGSYLLTVIVNKNHRFAGISEAVHIYPFLKTVYSKEFSNEDLLLSQYTVTFDANEATDGTAPTAQKMSAGSSITLPEQGILAKTNHTFEGWSTEADGTGINRESGTSYTVTENITLYANWKIITYTVSFDLNGGLGTTPSTINDVIIGSTLDLAQKPSPEEFTREYFLNDGKWYVDEECTAEFIFNTTPVMSDIILFLNWIDQRSTIIFSSLSADGSTTEATTQLTLIFDQAIEGFTENDITISGVDNVTKGILSGSGPAYTLEIDTMFNGTLNIKIDKAGIIITPLSRNVTVFGTPIEFVSVIPNGSVTQATTELTITLSEAIAGLTVDDITLSSVSNIAKGTLSGSGITYTLGITVTEIIGGTLNVTIEIAKPELNISPTSRIVTIFGYPPLTGTVSITGTAQVGNTLTANTSNLGGSGTISYQWQRGSSNISGATNSTYTIQATDRGSAIRVRVTRANNSGSVTSESTSTIPPEWNYTYGNFNSAIPTGWTTSNLSRTSSGGIDNTGCLTSSSYPLTSSRTTASVTTSSIVIGTNPVLSFRYKATTGSSSTSSAAANNALQYTVQISTDGTTYTNLSGYTNRNHVSSADYETITINLSAFANQTIRARIMFTWVTGTSYIWLDDVAFGTVPPIFFSTALATETVYNNYSSAMNANTRTHLISNKGSWPLDVSVASRSGGITVPDLTSTVTIPAYSSRTISVVINATSFMTGGTYNGSITFATNDPDSPSPVVNVTGTVRYAPDGILGNFNSAIPTSWTTSNFSRTSSGGIDNTGCLTSSSYPLTSSRTTASVTTSYIAVGANPVLSFKYKATTGSSSTSGAAASNALQYTVQISTDGTTWTNLVTNVPHVSASDFVTITPSISAYSRQVVWVRIIFTWVTGTSYIWLDDFNIQ